MDRILLAYDGSEPSRHAATRAAEVARSLGAPIEVIVVGELLESGYGTEVPVVEPEVYDGVLAEVLALVRAAGAEAEGSVVWGRPADSIVRRAQEMPADLVVLGHKGRGALEAFLMGSVAKNVIDHAHCSVLVVR